MSVRGFKVFKVTIPVGTAIGTTIYDVDERDGTLKNPQRNIRFSDYAGGMIVVDSTGWTDAELGLKVTYYDSETASDFLALKNHNGAYDPAGTDPIVIDGIVTNAKGAYAIPPMWFMAGYARLHSVNAATGADVNQTGSDKVIWVLLKS